MMDGPKPWERQPNESGQAFRAFAIYRDLNDSRSLDEAWKVFSPESKSAGAPGHFSDWSRRSGWADRVMAWDDERTGSSGLPRWPTLRR
jgi:hypothetical protein